MPADPTQSMSNPKDQKPLPSQGASAPGAHLPTRASDAGCDGGDRDKRAIAPTLHTCPHCGAGLTCRSCVYGPTGLHQSAWCGLPDARPYYVALDTAKCAGFTPRSESSQRAGDAGGRAETMPAAAPGEPNASSDAARLREEVSRLTAALAERTRERDEIAASTERRVLAQYRQEAALVWGMLRAAEARLAEVERALAIDEPEGEAADDRDGPWCRKCGEPYTMDVNHDPTPECDACAHEVLAAARRALALPATPPETKPATRCTGKDRGDGTGHCVCCDCPEHDAPLSSSPATPENSATKEE